MTKLSLLAATFLLAGCPEPSQLQPPEPMEQKPPVGSDWRKYRGIEPSVPVLVCDGVEVMTNPVFQNGVFVSANKVFISPHQYKRCMIVTLVENGRG